LGYLPSLLTALGVKADSQILVFSRTSVQSSHISPTTHRAIYFNDDAALGYVQGGDVIELTGLDPQMGVLTYTLENVKSGSTRIGRQNDCLRCHQGPATLAVPGLLVSSVHPRIDSTEGHGSAFITDQRTPLEERWGGWYVAGSTDSQSHLGNNIGLADPLHPDVAQKGAQNSISLVDFFDTKTYLASTSDIVALMTLEHQSRMTNLLTRVGWDARIAITGRKPPDVILKEMTPEIAEMISYMLFADEAPIQENIVGTSTFAKTFAQRDPRDPQGRSLRDFDLQTHLFGYRLSYMVYSAAFEGLPSLVRDQVYRRLFEILSGQDHSPKFARFSRAERAAIVAIVLATKQNLPLIWRSSAVHWSIVSIPSGFLFRNRFVPLYFPILPSCSIQGGFARVLRIYAE
jgi:hypothetical protein